MKNKVYVGFMVLSMIIVFVTLLVYLRFQNDELAKDRGVELTKPEEVEASENRIGSNYSEQKNRETVVEQADDFFELGRSYLYGINGKETNMEEAVRNFNKAFEAGRTDVYFYYGLMSEYYHYPEKDDKLAKEYYESDGNHPFNNLQLGLMYLEGKAVLEDRYKATDLILECRRHGIIEANIGLGALAEYDGAYEAALAYYAKALLSGEPFYQGLATFRIAKIYENKNYIKDYGKAISWYKLSAERNFTPAMNKIAKFYSEGKGVEMDFGKAREWFEKSASLRNSSALNELGLLYKDGRGVEQNFSIAKDYYEKAIELGSTVAITNLANLYVNGEGVKQDYDRAMNLYLRASERNDKGAIHNIGLMYEKGEGIPKDIELAMNWYKKAAEMGMVYSINKLAWFYASGEGTEQDFEKSMYWYQKASSLGSDYATMNIGWFYHHGKGVKQNYSKAVEWYQKAADMGLEEAKEKLEEVQKILLTKN